MMLELIGFELGKQVGCLFDDRIAINVSPDLVQELNEHFRRKALHTESYDEQGLARIKADFFDGVFRSWQAARSKKNEEWSLSSSTKLNDKKELK